MIRLFFVKLEQAIDNFASQRCSCYFLNFVTCYGITLNMSLVSPNICTGSFIIPDWLSYFGTHIESCFRHRPYAKGVS